MYKCLYVYMYMCYIYISVIKIGIIYQQVYILIIEKDRNNLKTKMHTPETNTPVQSRSGVRIVTSLGIYSSNNMEQKNRHILNSAKTIKQMICVNNNEQQQNVRQQGKEQGHINAQGKTQAVKSEQINNRNDGLACNNESVIGSERSLGKIIGENNLRKIGSYSNHVLTQSSCSNIGEFRQYNKQFYSGVEYNCRESQILANKYKSNIVYLQNQIKQIIKLTMFSSCLEEQKDIKQELVTLQATIRKLKLSIKEIRGIQARAKDNYRRVRELAILINEEKKISSQLQQREDSLQSYIQSKKSIMEPKKERSLQKKQRNQKFFTESQYDSSNLVTESEINAVQPNRQNIKISSRYMDERDIEQVGKPISGVTEIYEVRQAGFGGITQEQSQCSSQSFLLKEKIKQKSSKCNNHNQILQLTNNSENTINIYYDRIIRNSQKSHKSQYSDIIKQNKNHLNKQRISCKFNENLSTNFKFKTQKSKTFRRSSKQYLNLLEQRLKILKQGLKICIEDYDKKNQCIIKQKICIKKNIELFKLDTLKVEADIRKLNKLLVKKENQSIHSRSSQIGKRMSLSFDRRMKTLENSQQRRLGNENDMSNSSRKLIYWETRKVYAMNKQENASPVSHGSLSRRGSHRSQQSTGYLRYLGSSNEQRGSKFCSNRYQNNRVHANQEYFGIQQ